MINSVGNFCKLRSIFKISRDGTLFQRISRMSKRKRSYLLQNHTIFKQLDSPILNIRLVYTSSKVFLTKSIARDLSKPTVVLIPSTEHFRTTKPSASAWIINASWASYTRARARVSGRASAHTARAPRH